MQENEESANAEILGADPRYAALLRKLNLPP